MKTSLSRPMAERAAEGSSVQRGVERFIDVRDVEMVFTTRKARFHALRDIQLEVR